MFSQYLVTAQIWWIQHAGSNMMNSACRLNLCPVSLKCLSTGMALGSLTSFLWLFNCVLKAVSAFPTYWILQSKYMMKLHLQVLFWNVLLVALLLKCSVFIACLQNSVLEFEKHGEHSPLVNLLAAFYFFLLCSLQSTVSGSCFCGKLTGAYFQIPF